MVERTLSNLTITEYTIYEASKCLRRSFLFSKYTVYNLFHDTQKIKKRTLTYIPYEESLRYEILKKIYYYAVSILVAKEKLSFEKFKKISLFIIDKEIKKNKDKTLKNNLRQSNYDKIKKEIILELDKHFLIINPYDFENNIDNFLTLSLNVEEVVTLALERLRDNIKDKMIKIDFKGIPTLKLEILGIEKLNEFSFNIIITSIFNINDDLIHNDYILMIYFIYFKNFLKEDGEFKKNFNENVFLNEIIIYNPLTIKRTKVDYKKTMGCFSFSDFLRLLKIYNDGLDFKNLDKISCEYCENIAICLNKNTTMSKAKTIAIKKSKNT